MNNSTDDLTRKYNVALAALHAASACNNLGGFTVEHLPAIKAAVEQLDLPIPDVKIKPVEWKEVTKNGHKPGTWPHFFAHMDDISSGDKSVGAIRIKIGAINKELRCLDEFDDAYDTKRDERARLIKYATFVESIIDDVLIVMQNAATHFTKLLQQQELEQKAKPIAPVMPTVVAKPITIEQPAAPNPKRLTPQKIEAALIELCHGATRNIAKRYGVARRVMELILVNGLKETYTEDETLALDAVVHEFVVITMEHDDEITSSDMSATAWAWMRNTLEQIVEAGKQSKPAPQTQAETKPVSPMKFYTTGAIEAADDEDIKRFSSVKPKIVDHFEFAMNAIWERLTMDHPTEEDFTAAVNPVEEMMIALANECQGKKRKAILAAFTQAGDRVYDELFVDEDPEIVERTYKALNRLEQMLEPWFNTWNGPEGKLLVAEEQPKPKATKKSPKVKAPPAPRPSDGFGNDALRLQIAQVMQGIEDGNVPSAQA